ncbi:MAG: hypothetical protein IT440_08915 [Phycisphaeraceae bacterium]|nr:hypothetical protein [Phycisphaeraceae bacterium]
MNENDLHRQLLETEQRIRIDESRPLGRLTDYAHLAQRRTWRQAWDAASRSLGQPHDVTGMVWSDAIERCLNEHGSVMIPRMAEPIYIDRSIVLRSGNRLVADAEAEIRLIQGKIGICLVRNAGVVFSQTGPVQWCEGADEGILIEGGIWSDQRNEGRGQGGAYDLDDSMLGARGMFLLHNITNLVVRNVAFRDCSTFAIQCGNAKDFVIESIHFDETADGVHIEGPSSHGIIRHIAGKTNDDAVALNAWDWAESSLTFGPITDMLVEDVELQPGYRWSELRILPGTKIFPDGQTIDCDIRRCVYRNIRGAHTIKMYDQPNLGKPELDYADPIGRMSDMFFRDIVVDGMDPAKHYDPYTDGVFDICANVENLSIHNVRFNFTPGVASKDNLPQYLVSVGPKALTWPRGQSPEEGWKEVFNPNANPVVAGLTVGNVEQPDPTTPGHFMPYPDPRQLVHERHLMLNPDFPHTLPRGGTGRGKVTFA